MFSQKLLLGNYYEAVAVGVTRGADVKPHMDRKNDWRQGHDIMGALTSTGRDAKGYYRVGVFGYTRKDVGDHLRWMVIKENDKLKEEIAKLKKKNETSSMIVDMAAQ
eukprot:COSAG01_NODE_181_length_22873_cov_12.951392_26_plen_107_part_00